MKILSIQHYPMFGGPHNEIVKLEPHLNDLGVYTTVALTDKPGDAASRLEGHATTHLVPLERFRNPKNVRESIKNLVFLPRDIATLRQLIRTVTPDVVKVHGVHNPQGAIAASLEGVPVTLVISSDLPAAPFRKYGMQLAQVYTASVLATGARVLRAYAGSQRLLDRTFTYVPPVDTERFRPPDREKRARIRELLGVPASGFVVGSIANINPQKGVDVLVDAAAIVQRHLPDAWFVIAGSISEAHSQYYRSILDRIRHLGMDSSRVLFLGGRSDVEEILCGFDVKVISSRAEGIPTTACEAMSVALPVISTDVGSVREVVIHGRNGLVVPPESPDALASSIVALARDEGLRTRLGEAGRQMAVERCDVKECARIHLGAYERAVEQGPSPLFGRRRIN